jgi:predicted nucleotidyltransferase
VISALDMQRARAAAVAREVVSRSPQGAIVSVFAGGSLARGEVWAAEAGGSLEIYSDVDIYVVARDASSVVAVKAAARAVAADAPAETEGTRFLRPPDVGVYTEADLRAQPLRPGTIDLASRHVHLLGDPSVPARLPSLDAARIPANEALYLLENRAMELSAGEPEGGERLALIKALKARLDVHAAHAIVSGSFAPTLVLRGQSLEKNPSPTLDGELRDEMRAGYRAAADVGAWLQAKSAETETRSALRSLARAWRVLAPIVLSVDGSRVHMMVARRCRSDARIANVREAIRLRRVAGTPLGIAAARALSLSQLSPRAALRMHALVREFAREEDDGERIFAGHWRYLDRLTRVFGFAGGDVDARARAMHRAIS